MRLDRFNDFVRSVPNTLGGHYLRSSWQHIYVASDLGAGKAVPGVTTTAPGESIGPPTLGGQGWDSSRISTWLTGRRPVPRTRGPIVPSARPGRRAGCGGDDSLPLCRRYGLRSRRGGCRCLVLGLHTSQVFMRSDVDSPRP